MSHYLWSHVDLSNIVILEVQDVEQKVKYHKCVLQMYKELNGI